MLAQGQINTAQFCSATTQAAYSLLTLHSYVFHVQERMRSFYEVGILSPLYS